MTETAFQLNEPLRVSIQATLKGIEYHSFELFLITLGSTISYYITKHYIPLVSRILLKHNFYGFDINKTTPAERQALHSSCEADGKNVVARGQDLKKKAIPESLGILAGGVYISLVIGLMLLLRMDTAIMNGLLMTITLMLLLGFVDDVLDISWRYKIFFSGLGSLPLIMIYDGSTSVLIPPALVSYVNMLWDYISFLTGLNSSLGFTEWLQVSYSDGGLLLHLGAFYILYLALLCTFCTNSINILAGVNGIEVGQCIIIAIACMLYNILQLRLEHLPKSTMQRSELSSEHQIRALLLLGPFVGVSAALWVYNRYPARIFVGDSYTYFGGTVLAVAAIAGVYSKTLLLFFFPQIFNFLISLPQLFRIVKCPRHRVPRWIASKDVLTNSHNYTILNVILFFAGDRHERTLTTMALGLQTFTCVIGFFLRYLIASWMYNQVN